jgi:asparagine synthase (glutamine-hydrolysing)
MCGIAGIIGISHPIEETSKTNLRAMTTALRHRGPDSIGYYTDASVALGNTRLNIIDLSDNAHLPMTNENGSIWIAYNGEVTNFKELKKTFHLEKKHTLQSSSDTEILIHLYEELGISFLDHLSGMFAFCLYDTLKKKVYIVRDFYGIRPLFYMKRNDTFYFASEIKAFLELPFFKGTLDYEAIYHFLSLAYIPGEHTPFKEIRELDGGHLIEIDLLTHSLKEKEYYTLSYPVNYDMSEKDASKRVHDLLLDSVERNLISDAPLGLTLSGGLDTSTILALTKELGKSTTLHTYSIKMGEASFDESRFQQLMARFAQSIHHEILVTPEDVLNNFVEHMAFMDEPSGDGAAIPSYILAKEAKKEVRVLLSGEGGDEVFNAYETHRAYLARKHYRTIVPPFLRTAIKEIARTFPTSYKKLSFDFLAKRFSEGAELDIPSAHYFWRHSLNAFEKKALMPRHSDFKETETLFSSLYHSLPHSEELNRLSHIDIKYYFICDLMVKNDRTMMAHSIEARFPYMDKLLIDFTSTIPPSLKVKGLRGRYIQKEAMKHILPRAIYNRSNMGLEMPHSIWFLKEFEALLTHYFSKKNVAKYDFLSHDAIQTMWNQHKTKKKDQGRSLWCVLNLLLWLDLFVDSKDYKKYLPSLSMRSTHYPLEKPF